MFFNMLLSVFLPAFWLPGSLAIYFEYFPPPVEGLTVLPFKQNKEITLSYKQVSAILRNDVDTSNCIDQRL
jgi:hypothetical protein